ncbi:MAG: sensor histidine kinase [Gammaproteobacteria bacterium]|nr:sensor histidine kinase [Gammaproteobacteria bacterium]MBU2676242.1 sensor histidine kinase [Gammaproteobacteria bacterium]NNC56650.1 sensor histidine kinase [Woeseiaceae bacterium]NNL49977.1 sensor histidine kinase [Woeseiaceae bacterium]
MKTDPALLSSDGETDLAAVMKRVQQISAENETLVQRLADGEFRFRHLAKAVWQVQEEERRSIALELHDGIGQLLTALINHLQYSAGDTAAAESDKSIELATTALAEIRRLSRALRPSVLDDLGLEAALRWLARTTSEASDLDISLAWPDEDVTLDKLAETLVFRIVQEALTNVVKHADASRARIVVSFKDDAFQVSITDNGCGFDADAVLNASDRGFGTRGMRDRAELFGGQLAIESAPDEGTSVLLQLQAASR